MSACVLYQSVGKEGAVYMNNSIYGNCTFNDIRDDMHCSIQLLVWLFLARL